MKLKLKNKKLLKRILIINSGLTILIALSVYIFNISWNILDYKVTDWIYKKALVNNKGPKISSKIVYLNITDNTYDYFKTNYLNREFLAKIDNVLAELSPQAVFYDIIFPRSSRTKEDEHFAQSIENLGNVYLPAGFKLSSEKKKFRWMNGVYFDELKNDYLKKLKTSGTGMPYYASGCLPQNDLFAKVEHGSGHISVVHDADGIVRHFPLIIKIDSLYFPAVSLSLFLDYNEIPFDSVEINWGKYVKIPAVKNSYLDKGLIIPIDNTGSVFVPFQNFWLDNKIKMMEAQNLLKYINKPEYLNDLLEYFEGSFVLIGDISVGSSDLAQTTIDNNVPLVSIHSALLNGMLTNSFYSQWDNTSIALLILPLGFLLGFISIFKSNLPLYVSGVVLIMGALFFTYFQITGFILFPFFTVGAAIFLITLGMIVSLNVFISKDQAFIKGAFSKYVPPKVVDSLLEQPDLLKLGGEERELTILFSDIANFTTISEKMNSTDLVSLLNKYLTKMTDLILEQGGIIDKYIGDAILAEFGAPIPFENHPDAAVATALFMQKKLSELNINWAEQKYPAINSRIGINTGNVIIGNMGSDQVFDYTVIGDTVNLASRLESANKFYKTKIMISEFTYKKITKDKFQSRVLDVIKVKGKSKAVKVYEVYGFSGEKILEQEQNYFNAYEQAFDAYLLREFKDAKELFKKALSFRQADTACVEMLLRIEKLDLESLPEEWDGSIALKEK